MHSVVFRLSGLFLCFVAAPTHTEKNPIFSYTCSTMVPQLSSTEKCNSHYIHLQFYVQHVTQCFEQRTTPTDNQLYGK